MPLPILKLWWLIIHGKAKSGCKYCHGRMSPGKDYIDKKWHAADAWDITGGEIRS